MAWYALATHLHTPVQRVMRETTSREFLKWRRFLKDLMNTPSREDYYLAQIAARVYQTVAKEPNKVRVEDFLLEFTEQKEAKEVPLTEEVVAQRTANSKAAWFGIAGHTVRTPPPQKGSK